MTMQRIAGVFALALIGVSVMKPAPGATLSFAEADAMWQASKKASGYGEFLLAFAQWNNSLKLDARGNCYAKLAAPVDLLLVFSEHGLVSNVLASSAGEGVDCFREAYIG